MGKTIIIAFLAITLCVGCNHAGNGNTISKSSGEMNSKETKASNENKVPNDKVTSSDEPKETRLATSSSEASSDSLNTLNPMQKYIDFIDDDHAEQVAFTAKEDIDLDGYDEIVVAFGNSNEDPELGYVSELYILRDIKGEIVQLGDDLAGGGYGTYEVKLIQLQNKQQTYVYFGITNGGGLRGFQIYGLTGNEPVLVEYSASATGSGEDELRDFNNDGQFDGYVQNRSSYDVLYYQVTRTFDWISDNNNFEIRETHVDIPEYPDQIKDILYQYLSLRLMAEDNSPEIHQRLTELCSYAKENNIKIDWDHWGSALLNDYWMGSEEKINFEIDERTETATATVTALDDEGKKVVILFKLARLDDRWVIREMRES
jgi:hypothetical protein